MKIKTYYLILAAAVGCICVHVSGRAEPLSPGEKYMFTSRPHPAFAGIDKLHVTVLRYVTKSDKDVPLWKQLEADVREKLQQAGIESDTTADNILDTPELRIYVSTLRLEGSQQYVFSVRTALARGVCIKNELNPVFKADIWQAFPKMQAVTAEDISLKVTNVVLEQTEAFIQAFKASNPPVLQVSEAAISGPEAKSAPAKYVASNSSTIFHKPDCRWAKNISGQNLVSYTSKDEAIKAGKRPCKTCNP
jgi:hypothetical protein